ncbi:aryl-sulfate sulfotransferase [Yokenella regensburgei]|uniref:aryl-sulfate sulfotransferase n=1 Tax=Yokenella regensburgei TaxID=158877 RepID=UPI003CD084D7
MGATVLDNSDTDDVHFNRLEYIAETNQLMVNSRSSCTIIGLNIDSGDMEWIIDNLDYPVLNKSLTLSVADPER